MTPLNFTASVLNSFSISSFKIIKQVVYMCKAYQPFPN